MLLPAVLLFELCLLLDRKDMHAPCVHIAILTV
jgi:hypothetical protein